MKNSILSIRVIVLIVGGMLAHSQASGQTPIVVPLRGGGSVAILTRTYPEEVAHSFMPSIEVEFDNVIHHVIVNESAGYYFGYDLVITQLPELRQFKVMVKPLDTNYDKSLLSRNWFKKHNIGQPDPKALTPSLSKPSAPRIVDDGATFFVDLLANEATGAKVWDLITVSFDDLRPPGDPSRGNTPRDFTLDDVDLSVSNYRLLINGNLVASKLSTGFSAPILWFYLPDKGRFIFSIRPREGFDFQKIGFAEHNNLSFTVNGDHYLWSSTSPIVQSGGNWNIWVLYEPDYKPDQITAKSPKVKKTPKIELAKVPSLDWGSAQRIEELYPKRKE